MLRRHFTISVLFLIVMMLPLYCFSEEPKTKLKGPVTITSETLSADNKARTALFEKNVVVKTGDLIIYADSVLVHYKDAGGQITEIDARGNVKLNKGGLVIVADQAIYYADEDKVVFTGNPRAIDGENVVTGSKMIFYVADDRSYVENSKVFIKK